MPSAPNAFEAATYRRVTWRLIPFLFLCYILAYLDRVNVGFAKLQMQHDLGLSDAVYGVGAGIFFIGYFLFEVPSNLVLERVGARVWIARIMVVWGLVSAAMALTSGPGSFYALRFLLGVAEAGFFPGVILYLTYWYTRAHRARMVAAFMTAIALAGVVGGPVSGWILGHLDLFRGLRGWQWLFLLEGLPAVAVGLLVLRWLDDGPARARWLSAEERDLLRARLAEEERHKEAGGEHHRCGIRVRRDDVQALLLAWNPGLDGEAAPARPDGDARLGAEPGEMRLPDCPECGGVLKPSVVFFGENVPRPRVDAVLDDLKKADALLVVGSSLMVYSGFRFALAARAQGRAVAAVNLGRTRADDLLDLKVAGDCSSVLPHALARLPLSALGAA